MSLTLLSKSYPLHGARKNVGEYREQFVLCIDNLPCEARFLGIKRVFPVQHRVQDDAAAPDVCNLHEYTPLSSSHPDCSTWELDLHQEGTCHAMVFAMTGAGFMEAQAAGMKMQKAMSGPLTLWPYRHGWRATL